jgi:hypothetical protein
MNERLGQQMSEAKNNQVGIVTELIESKRDLENSLGEIHRTCRKEMPVESISSLNNKLVAAGRDSTPKFEGLSSWLDS